MQDPNERFTSLAQILAQANQEPQQRVRKAKESSPESEESEEEAAPARRSVRERRLTKRYLERDSSAVEESG